MIVEFRGKKTSHIPEWCRENPEGYLLELQTSTFARLHSASFDKEGQHFEIVNSTGCSTQPDELIKWGESKKRKILACSACFPNGFASLGKSLPNDVQTGSWPFPTSETPAKASSTEPSPSKPDDNVLAKETPLVEGVQVGSNDWSEETASEHNESVDTQSAVSAIEGILREAIVITKSRNGTLRRAALKRACGVCAACGIDYSHILDGLGQRVLQVHHRQQLALADEPQVNGIEDLAVVCANCHQMIHADTTNAMSVEELRKRFTESKLLQKTSVSYKT